MHPIKHPTTLKSAITLTNKPRTLVLGNIQHRDVVEFLGCKSPGKIRDSIQAETYGLGYIPSRFDHWLPAPDSEERFYYDIFMSDSEKRDYKFDLVIIDVRNWMIWSRCSLDELWQDSLSYLAIGGTAVIVGEPRFLRPLIGSFSFRMDQFHIFPEIPTYRSDPTYHFLVGTRRESAHPNTKGKQLLASYLEQYDPLTQPELISAMTPPAPCSLLEPASYPIKVNREQSEDPFLIPRKFSLDYLAAASGSLQGPFENIRKHLYHSGVSRKIRLPMSPTIGNLAKLATLADFPVTDENGDWWVIKGVSETVHVSVPGDELDDEDKTRDLKRLTMFGVKVTGDNLGEMFEGTVG